MSNYWPVLLAIAVVALIFVIRRRRPARQREERALGMPRVEGFQVTGPLHPRMTRACVFDLGLQYGKGFRRKDGPALPHGPECKCRTTPFVFSGSEVFGGSLKRFAPMQCDLPGFPAEACKPLLDALRRMNAEPVPETLTDYLAQAGLEADLPAEQREAIRRFLEERFGYLSAQRTAAGPEGPQPDPPDAH